MSEAGELTIFQPGAGRRARLRAAVAMTARYGVTAAGPMTISAAHFIAAFLFLHSLSPTNFGMFSFLLVIVPLCLSASGALLGASVQTSAFRNRTLDSESLATHLKANVMFSAFAGIIVFAAMLYLGTAPPIAAVLLGVYASFMALRWFARAYTYVLHKQVRVSASDATYGILLVAGLAVLFFVNRLTVLNASVVLAASAGIAILPFGVQFLRLQATAIVRGALSAYLPIWRDLARWSLLGVVLTEMTANAHAYLVTFLAGPKSFALIALGTLFMRPVSLCLTALPDLERPVMAKAIAAGDLVRANASVRHLRMATGAVWLGTVLLSATILIWFPDLMMRKNYDPASVGIVVAIWSAILIVRQIRTPESILLQAAGEFRDLAGASMMSSIISVVLTFVLLLAFGPIVSLCGVLAGDSAMTIKTLALARRWRARHG